MTKLPQIIRIAVATVVLAATVAGLPATASSAPADRAAPAGALDRPALQKALDAIPAAGAPGVFASVRDGGQTWRGAAGIADLSNARPMRPGLRERAGSITKTFVATTLLQLVGEGRLGLDDPVGQWLPDLVPGEVGQQVTVRMLLNHTSGIGNYTDAILNSLATVQHIAVTTYTPQQLVAIALGLPRTGAPGAKHSYSNTNYILAGLLIQRVTGRDPADEVTRRIIRPLRLVNTYLAGTEPVIDGPHSGAYFALLGTRNMSDSNMSWAWLAGALVSTPDDLDTFFRALLGGRLLPPAMLAQMRTTVPLNPARPEAGGYGLGIYWLATPCGPVWGHDGLVVGQSTVSLQTPDGSRQVSFAINLSHYQVPGEDHPIDVAVGQFIIGAFCPGVTATDAQPGLSFPLPDSAAMTALS